jgi:hypothetical protein
MLMWGELLYARLDSLTHGFLAAFLLLLMFYMTGTAGTEGRPAVTLATFMWATLLRM